MKKIDLSIRTIYQLVTVTIVFAILFPLLFWTYSDLKDETRKNIKKYFSQSKSVVEVIIENKIDSIDANLDLLSSLDLNKDRDKIDNMDLDNIDILFFKFNDKKPLNYSSSFLYDTDKIIDKILKDDLTDKKFIITVGFDEKRVSILYSSKKIINKETGKVEGIIAAGEILNNNITFLSKILNKTSIKSVSLLHRDQIISSTIPRDTLEYKVVKNIDLDYRGLIEKNRVIFYKDNFTCTPLCEEINIIFTTDNDPFDQLYDNFKNKSILIVLIFILIASVIFIGIKKLLIKPVNKLISINDEFTKSEYTFIKEINAITDNLSKTMNTLNEYKKAVNVSSIVSKGDIEGNITYVNKIFCYSTGYGEKELIGKPHSILRDPSVPSSLFKDMWKRIKDEKKPWSGYLSNKKKNGEIFHIKLTITPILDEENNIVEFLSLRENITELVESKKTLENIYIMDKLTGLFNRYKLTMDLKENDGLNILLLNIDRFSQLNDFYGNRIGDEILNHYSKRIEAFYKPKAFNIYRVYGDEFAVSFNKVEIDDMLFATKLFIKQLSDTPFFIEDFKINISVSAGISRYEKDATFINADLALKTAKKENKECIVFTEDNPILKEHANNLNWTHKIKDALYEDRIVPFFQPIRNNETKKIEKYECLVRLIEKDGKVVSPFFFLDIAKKSKLYDQITRVMVRKSLEYFKDKEYEFSINLTIDDILNEQTVKFLKTNILKFDIANRVVFEIVESEQIERFEEIAEFMEQFKSYGCKIAIDDFGTGYSNFEYLIKLNVDYIKIDGSLIKNILDNDNMQSVVETIVEFSHKSDMKVIAEYIASKEIQEKIEEFNIDYSQGYYYGEPKREI